MSKNNDEKKIKDDEKINDSISEDIEEITKYLDSTKSEKPVMMYEEDILTGTMKFKKCNLVKAKCILKEMLDDGLELFETLSLSSGMLDIPKGKRYNLSEYGILREYLKSNGNQN